MDRIRGMDPTRALLAGRYRLEHVIGRGGMSTVYRATDTVLGRTVAVKVLLAGLAAEDQAYIARFEREARAAAALRNPAVVSVYDVGVDGDTRFIVMEHVAGRSLGELLKDSKPLELEQAVRIGREVAAALGAAHAAGIVHRDIKPANVMIAEEGTVKVLDFGVARMLDGTTITQTASVLGTAAYMAPERALGEPGDERSDIYSLGCLMYAMLTGTPPFKADHAAALLHQQVNAKPRPVRKLRPEVPAALAALIGETLAKSPARRPQSAYAVRDRLAVPVDPTAPTIPLAARRPRPSHHRRALIAALATAAITLLVLLLGSGGGTPKQAPAAARHPVTTPRAPATTPTTTPANPAQAPVQPAATPKPSGHGPPGHDKGPPPGHKKHHGGPGKDH